MKIGIFGGTFDPPHLGHLILAAEALDQLNLDRILWVLTPTSPFKTQQEMSSVKHRKRLVELATESEQRFQLSCIDIDREPPYYAIDTVMLLKDHLLGDEFYYLMGLDSLNDLPAWHRPKEFTALCNGIVVMIRHGQVLDIRGLMKEIPDLDLKLYILQTPIIEISASDIRLRVKRGIQFKYFVPEKVHDYIIENNLYKDQVRE